ncbi:hypothetical protein HYV12_03830 [Candidatus Dojkabacteria bacterium]|nr:hypothetical protein [Candidatus Dojkabacteria bacterium]
MFKRQSFKKLGKTATHRKSMKKNLLRSIFQSGYVTTTTPKAKMLKAEVESFISSIVKAEKGLNLERRLENTLGTRTIVEEAVNYVGSNKGLVKITKVGYRAGDNAQVSKVELVGFKVTKKEVVKKVSKKEKKTEVKDVETKEVKPVAKKGLRGILTSTKGVNKNVSVKKERARTRSGL